MLTFIIEYSNAIVIWYHALIVILTIALIIFDTDFRFKFTKNRTIAKQLLEQKFKSFLQ